MKPRAASLLVLAVLSLMPGAFAAQEADPLAARVSVRDLRAPTVEGLIDRLNEFSPVPVHLVIRDSLLQHMRRSTPTPLRLETAYDRGAGIPDGIYTVGDVLRRLADAGTGLQWTAGPAGVNAMVSLDVGIPNLLKTKIGKDADLNVGVRELVEWLNGQLPVLQMGAADRRGSGAPRLPELRPGVGSIAGTLPAPCPCAPAGQYRLQVRADMSVQDVLDEFALASASTWKCVILDRALVVKMGSCIGGLWIWQDHLQVPRTQVTFTRRNQLTERR